MGEARSRNLRPALERRHGALVISHLPLVIGESARSWGGAVCGIQESWARNSLPRIEGRFRTLKAPWFPPMSDCRTRRVISY